MKKTILIVCSVLFMTSCATHNGRVCGGKSGKRCVENSDSIIIKSPKKIQNS
jgi:hypothetical protein